MRAKIHGGDGYYQEPVRVLRRKYSMVYVECLNLYSNEDELYRVWIPSTDLIGE